MSQCNKMVYLKLLLNPLTAARFPAPQCCVELTVPIDFQWAPKVRRTRLTRPPHWGAGGGGRV